MKKYNKGEWAEVFCVLYILNFPNISIVDSNFKVISKDIFEVLKVCYPNAKFYIKDEHMVKEDEENISFIPIEEIKNILKDMEIKILNEKKTTFKFTEIDRIFNNIKIKGSSSQKGDICAEISDRLASKNVILTYSVKSYLGSNPTLLNASSSTNFKYKLVGDNMNDEIMERINGVNGRSKIIDRMNILKSNNICLEHDSICNENFERNLEMCDSKLPNILSLFLLNYYDKKGNSFINLIEVLDIKDKELIEFKIKNFLFNFMVSIFPSKKWDGEQEVTGGILAVKLIDKNKMTVNLLDIIYYKKEVLDYLYKYSYFETPSTSRYKMLDIFKEEDDYYTTLNLQIRLCEPK